MEIFEMMMVSRILSLSLSLSLSGSVKSKGTHDNEKEIKIEKKGKVTYSSTMPRISFFHRRPHPTFQVGDFRPRIHRRPSTGTELGEADSETEIINILFKDIVHVRNG